MDRTILQSNLSFQYNYNNKKLNLLTNSNYGDNYYILGWLENDNTDSLIQLIIDTLNRNNHLISIIDLINEIDSSNILLYHNKYLTKYDMFININNVISTII